jgi:hypothetical protein
VEQTDQDSSAQGSKPVDTSVEFLKFIYDFAGQFKDWPRTRQRFCLDILRNQLKNSQ